MTSINYNYSKFSSDSIDLRYFPGPRAGRLVPGFLAEDLNGNIITLSKLSGTRFVLETASLTCPMYARNVRTMNELRDSYPDISFIVLYVREAHPGSNTPAHRTFEEKMACARSLSTMYGEKRRILVDSLDGAIHTTFGLFPNMVYVISPKGIVEYRSDWVVVPELRKALKNPGCIVGKEHVEPFLRWPLANPFIMLKGGWNAIFDFIKALPSLVINHLQANFLYLRRKKLHHSKPYT